MKIQTFSILAGTALCNARCPYCVSKMTGIKKAGFNEPAINWRNFEKACRLSQVNDVSTVLITGKGEPTLYPKQITKFLEKMRKYNFPLIEIQTNGISLGKEFNKYKKYLEKWYKLGLNTIAISIVHYEKQKNREIFTPYSDYFDLKVLIKRLHNLGFSVRLSCLLMEGFIDSPEKVGKLIEFAKINSVEQLTIRRLWLTQNSENPEIAEWCEKQVLAEAKIKEIIKYVEKNARKLMTLGHGAVVYDFKGQNVCITDCIMIHPNTDEIRTLVFFPDGHLRYDWDYGGATLL